MFNPLYLINLEECAASSDCPDGGTNYLCIDYVCECPSNMIEENDKCVGMLKSLKSK